LRTAKAVIAIVQGVNQIYLLAQAKEYLMMIEVCNVLVGEGVTLGTLGEYLPSTVHFTGTERLRSTTLER
jgi:hypothetical protein